MTIALSYYTATREIKNIAYKNDLQIKHPPQFVIYTVCQYFDITEKEVMAKSRRQDLVNCRRFIMRMLKDHSGLTLKSIGKYTGDKDHTTVIHSMQKLSDLMETEEGMRYHYSEIKKLFL